MVDELAKVLEFGRGEDFAGDFLVEHFVDFVAVYAVLEFLFSGSVVVDSLLAYSQVILDVGAT